MYYVYILHSKSSGRLYKGKSENLQERLHKHNSGNVTSTRPFRPWILVYYQGFLSKKDASREEIFLKTGKGRERIKFLLEDTLNGKI